VMFITQRGMIERPWRTDFIRRLDLRES